MRPVRLSLRGLEDPALSARRPPYSRDHLAQGILHMSLGGFHRAHAALFIHELLARHGVRDWAICAVGLRGEDARMRDALVPQDCLYTLLEKGGGAVRSQVIGSLTQYLLAPDEPGAVLGKLCEPGIRIVTLTVTEKGYFLKQATGAFDADAPGIREDLGNPGRPATMLGFIVEGLRRRREAGLPPFTVLSCDNIQANGAVARRMVLAFAALRDKALADWIERNVAFPSCMVDRITPVTTDEDRAFVLSSLGYEDAWPVACETFRQWVIEDRFPAGRPPWEKVGVQMTSDVRPYEKMKIRLLNASHFALGYVGFLAGYTYVHEVMRDPVFTELVRRLMDEEVTPVLDPLPGIDLDAYKRQLRERFANEAIRDQLTRICQDGSPKAPKFLLPSVVERLAAGGSVKYLAIATAGWLRYLSGVDEKGGAIAIDDPLAETLRRRAREGGEDPRALLSVSEVFGSELPRNAAFVSAVSDALRDIYRKGSRRAVAELLG